MAQWFLMAGNKPEIAAVDVERDKYEVFSKSYLNRLVWYYLNHIKKLHVFLPEHYDLLIKKLSDDYDKVNFNSAAGVPYQTGEYCVLLSSKYVIDDLDWLMSIEELKPAVRDWVRIYKSNDRVIAVLLTGGALDKIKIFNSNSNDELISTEQVAELAQSYFDNVESVKIKKKNFIAIDNLKSIQRFMTLINKTKVEALLQSGVMIWDVHNTWIEPDVKVAKGTVIYPGTLLKGATSIGKDCLIGPAARIENSELGCEIAVKDSTIIASKIDDQSTIGPYAYLRPKSDIGKNVKIGDFVEVKNARVDDGSKVSHLSYIGDGDVGKNVNVGCGVVFVNYDGKYKHRTTVEDNVFVGCNANLVAPVTIKQGAYVAAGSTITDEVAADSLAIARARQIVKQNWVKRNKSE